MHEIKMSILAAMGAGILAPQALAQEQLPDQTISVMAVEYKMRRSVDETPYPNTLEAHPELADAPGYKLIPPNTEVEGEWGVDAYQWVPGTIVVNQGETVLLQFYGVNGDEHPATIEGYDLEFTARRGELTEVQFVADTAGTFQIVCHTHTPTMVAQLVVLPAP